MATTRTTATGTCSHTPDGVLLFDALLPGKVDVRQVALAAIRGEVVKLRDAFPALVLALRADNGFACPALCDFCEDQDIEYFVNVGTHQKMVEESPRQSRGLAPSLTW